MVVLADDQRRPRRRLAAPASARRRPRRTSWPSIGADDVPAIGLEALAHVVHVPGLDGAVDADAVVVVQRDQLVQLPGRRPARRPRG